MWRYLVRTQLRTVLELPNVIAGAQFRAFFQLAEEDKLSSAGMPVTGSHLAPQTSPVLWEAVDPTHRPMPSSAPELSGPPVRLEVMEEVKFYADPPRALFHVVVTGREGTPRDLFKRWLEIADFLDSIRPQTRLSPLPRDIPEDELFREPMFRYMVKSQFRALLDFPGIVSSPEFQGFFQVDKSAIMSATDCALAPINGSNDCPRPVASTSTPLLHSDAWTATEAAPPTSTSSSYLLAGPPPPAPVSPADAAAAVAADKAVRDKRRGSGGRRVSEVSCVICMAEPLEVAAEPCGHMAMCRSCAEMVDECPMCREKITRRMRVYSAK